MSDTRKRRAYDDTRIRDIKGDGPSGLLHIATGQLLRTTIDYLHDNRIGLALVVDGEGSLVGVISERDVIRAIYEHGGHALDMPTDNFASRDVYTCSADDRAVDVARIMTERHFRHAPIVSDGYLAGMVSASDLVRYFSTLA